MFSFTDDRLVRWLAYEVVEADIVRKDRKLFNVLSFFVAPEKQETHEGT